ncbi:type VII toxin-antitoxin system MntA family adenylyltransferase antitoxin [Tunicatimonas pelagia]|uniref:type VII toxin-antitoxin system MntA family adenylyltransferase antitoxin n=1 Tax=Tunicatimonas pelagia TaxID=931531 RepID=UPI0026652786|nr:nucleotidyltransferase domain-containing protein [Tunicatimonas pelagia]WKN40634.1 nucleotidyltransferase domain-containing protein [Tunicatimonas pelagia]
MMSLNQQITSYLLPLLPNTWAIYLFGSYAQQQVTAESDIDIAVLGSQQLKPVHRREIIQQLAKLLGREVDLVDLQQASTVVQFQVVSTGERIYCHNENEMAWWKLKVYQLYLTLNDDRKPILEEIKRTRTIYGR